MRYWCRCWLAVGHAASEGGVALPERMRFSICRRYVRNDTIEGMREPPSRTSLYGRSHPRRPTARSDRRTHRRLRQRHAHSDAHRGRPADAKPRGFAEGRCIALPASSSRCSKSSAAPKAESSAPKNSWSERGTRTQTRSPTRCATMSALRKPLGEPGIIATVSGDGYRISSQPDRARRRRAWIGPLG
jgi:hypothetical protein